MDKLLPLIGDGRALYLPVSDESAPFALRRFKAAIASGRIRLLPLKQPLSEQRDGAEVLSLAALADGLAPLGEPELRNLLVLLPNGLAWDMEGLPTTSALGLVGFVLLNDFVTGTPIQRVELMNLGRLAQIFSRQA